MPDLAPPTASAHPDRPFAVVLPLTLGVWASALVPTARPFDVATGFAPDLAGVIRSAPRAVVFVDESSSTYPMTGRKKFFEDTRRNMGGTPVGEGDQIPTRTPGRTEHPFRNDASRGWCCASDRPRALVPLAEDHTSQRDAGPRRPECYGQTDRSGKVLNEQEFLAKVRHVARQIVERVNRVLGEDAPHRRTARSRRQASNRLRCPFRGES